MIRRPPRSTQSRSSAASDVYKRQHYHELNMLESQIAGIVNAHVDVDERDGEIIFLHHIADGGTDDSYGIEVARLAGVPVEVVERAKDILHELESERKIHG